MTSITYHPFIKLFLGGVLSFMLIVSVIKVEAENPHQSPLEWFIHAKVIKVLSSTEERLETTDVVLRNQSLEIELLEKPFKGERITIMNDFIPLKENQKFIARITEDSVGEKTVIVSDFERRPLLVGLGLLFIGAIIFLGRMQGLRSLVSLGVSVLVIFYILIPFLLKGYHPMLISTLAATSVLFFAIFFTHGFTRRSLIAFSGTMSAVIITSILAQLAVHWGSITGFSSHEAVYLNGNTGGSLDFVGLFLAGIMIGMLGVLDDIAITQVAVVRELYAEAHHLTRAQIFQSALRVGKEHVSALVNTLVLAYVGVALPSLLYFATADASPWHMVNMEVFAGEIIRTLIGSLGLIITVPITTWLAVIFLEKFRGKQLTASDMMHSHSHGATHEHHHG